MGANFTIWLGAKEKTLLEGLRDITNKNAEDLLRELVGESIDGFHSKIMVAYGQAQAKKTVKGATDGKG